MPPAWAAERHFRHRVTLESFRHSKEEAPRRRPPPFEKRQEMGTCFRPASALSPLPHGWRSYCFGFSEVGFSSTVLAAGALGFEADAIIAAFGCQKSAATVAISSGGLLSSAENRKSVDSAPSTDSAFTCRNFL